jgi:hypothetical protein
MEGSNYEVGDYVFIRAQVIHPQKQNRNKPKNFQVFAVDEDVMISLDEARKLVREKKR